MNEETTQSATRKADRELLALQLVMFVPLAGLVVVFCSTDLTAWDMVGHLRAASYYRDHLWPSFVGWTSSQGFGGYPQGYFYPPLLAWLVGGLGKIVPLAWAFRALVGASILLLPLSALAFLRALGCERRAATSAVFCLLTGLLVATPKSLGGFFSATFGGGLVTAAWTLPFVFFYLAALRRLVAGWRGVFEASAWLALVVLGHGFNAIAAALLSAVYVPFFAGDRRALGRCASRYVAHAVVTLGLAAAFVVPAATYHEWTSGRAITGFNVFGALRAGLWFYVPVGAIFLWASARALRRRDRVARGLAYPVLLVVLLYLLARWLRASGTFGFPLHSYRIVVFAVMFACLAAGRAAALRPFHRMMIWSTVATFLAGVVLCLGRDLSVRDRTLRVPAGVVPFTRGLVDESMRSELTRLGSPHLLVSTLEAQGVDVLNGIFVESSAVSPYVSGLLRERDANAFVGSVDRVPAHPELAAWHASLLGAQWFLTESPGVGSATVGSVAPAELAVSVSSGGNEHRESWSLGRMDHPLAELFVTAPALPGSSPWGTFVRSWWEGKSTLTRIPVRLAELPAAFEAPEPGDRVELRAMREDDYELEVESGKPRWVYLKLPYFPTWHAYQGGEEVPLYEASVHLMAVYGRGTIELRPTAGKVEGLSAAASLAAWSALLLGLLGPSLVRRGRIPLPLPGVPGQGSLLSATRQALGGDGGAS
jgi:hypothetical protein